MLKVSDNTVAQINAALIDIEQRIIKLSNDIATVTKRQAEIEKQLQKK